MDARATRGPCCARGGGENGHTVDCPRNSVGFVAEATRAIWLAVREHGLERDPWGYSKVPDLVSDLREVIDLKNEVCTLVGEDPKNATRTQILLRLPDVDNEWTRVQYEPHVDKTPEGGLYRRVIGCCLTISYSGTVIINGETIGFRKGEIFGWTGDVVHQGVPNLSSIPRLTAYWRFL